MRFPLAVRIVAFAAVGLTGYLVGSRSAPSPTSPGVEQNESGFVISTFLSQGGPRKVSPAMETSINEALKEPSSRKRLKALRRLSQGLEVSEIPGFLEQLRKSKDRAAVSLIQWELLAEWASVDPKAAMAYAASLDERYKDVAIGSVVSAWAEVDEAAAVAWIEGLPKGKLHSHAKQALMSSIGERDISRFVSLVIERKDSWREAFGSYFGIWNSWASRDPRAAVEAALRLPAGMDQNNALQTIATTWGQIDPKAALAWVVQLPDGVARTQSVQSLVSALAQKDPQEAIRVATTELMGRQQINAISQAISQWAMKDHAAALAWVEQLPIGQQRQQAVFHLVQQWVQSDPNAALQYALVLPHGSNRNNTISSALQSWLRNDFDAASSWLKQNASAASPDVLTSLVGSMSHQNPDQAMALLAFVPESGTFNNHVYNTLGSSWGMNDPARAVAHLDSMPEGAARDQFLSGFIGGLSHSDPVVAGYQILKLPEGKQRDQMAQQVASSWARIDPIATLEWTSKLPAGEAQNQAVGNVVREWANADNHAAAKYVNSLPVGSTRDTAMQQFASTMIGNDPEGAAIWASAIGDEKKRENSLNNVIRTWKRNDPAAAKAWIEASSQSPEWKEKMINAK